MQVAQRQMELLQEATELIVSEAGTHPSYRCLIFLQKENLFNEWTETSRDEVLDKLSEHVTVRALASVVPTGGSLVRVRRTGAK